MTWLLINIAKFIFMTTNEKVVEIPMSTRDIDQCTEYFLKINPHLYQSFVQFWSQHQRFTRKCDKDMCSRVFIVDGHQKANRLVCQYKNVFDCSISELGPVQMGCLYSPLRKCMFATLHLHSCQLDYIARERGFSLESCHWVFELTTYFLVQFCLREQICFL